MYHGGWTRVLQAPSILHEHSGAQKTIMISNPRNAAFRLQKDKCLVHHCMHDLRNLCPNNTSFAGHSSVHVHVDAFMHTHVAIHVQCHDCACTCTCNDVHEQYPPVAT